MRTIISITVTFICVTIGASQNNTIYASGDHATIADKKGEQYPSKEQNDIVKKVKLQISNTTIRVFSLAVPGQLVVSENSIKFFPRREFENAWGKFAYPDNYLIRDIEIDYANIKKIRRNWFYLFPNLTVIKTNDGKTLRLYSYKRKQVIERVRRKI